MHWLHFSDLSSLTSKPTPNEFFHFLTSKMAESKNIIPESKILHETMFTEFKGMNFLPEVLHQANYFPPGTIVRPEDGQCGSLSAAEVMQAKLKLWSFKRNQETPPVLSVQQLVDAHTPKPVDYLESVLRYLEVEGIVHAEEYKAAPSPNDGTRLKNVEGLTSHKIVGSTRTYSGPTNFIWKSKRTRAVNDLVTFGPLIGSMFATKELQHYTSGIIQGNNFFYNSTSGRVLTHAATIIGFGITTTGKQYWVMRNNWGRQFGKDGIFRIIMDLVSTVYSLQVNPEEKIPVQVHPDTKEESFPVCRRSARRSTS